MRIFVITGGMLGIPTLQELIKAKLLTGIGVPAITNQHISQITQMGKDAGLPVAKLQQKPLKRELEKVLDKQKPDLVLVFTFPYKIPAPVLRLPKLGFLNYHCARLPQYRGAQPNFWEIKNQEAYSAVTIHQMDANFDTGPIVYQEKVRIEPHFTHGMLAIKLSYMMVKATQMMFMQLQQLGTLSGKPQAKAGAQYHPKPQWNDLAIDWEKYTTSQIKALVRACNPEYQGAITQCKGLELRVYACSGTNLTNESHQAGSIVALNQTDGLCVACADGNAIKLDIVALEEGVMLGHQLSKLGFAVGDRFQDVRRS